MKNFLLGSIFILVVLPQVSFGQTTPITKTTPTTPTTVTTPSVVTPPPAVTPQPSWKTNPTLAGFENWQSAQALAFFTQQGKDRAAFIAAHGDAMVAQDNIIKAWAEDRRKKVEYAKRTKDWSGVGPSVLPRITDTTFSSFVAQQQAEKTAFFAAQTAAKQKFLADHPGL